MERQRWEEKGERDESWRFFRIMRGLERDLEQFQLMEFDNYALARIRIIFS